MTNGDFKDLARRTASDKILHNKAFKKEIKEVLHQCFINFFDQKTSGSSIKNENISNQRPFDLATRELAKKLHKPVIREFGKRKYTQLLQTIFDVLIFLICN